MQNESSPCFSVITNLLNMCERRGTIGQVRFVGERALILKLRRAYDNLSPGGCCLKINLQLHIDTHKCSPAKLFHLSSPYRLCTPTTLTSPFPRIPVQPAVLRHDASSMYIFLLIYLENMCLFFEAKFKHYIFYDLSGTPLGRFRFQ